MPILFSKTNTVPVGRGLRWAAACLTLLALAGCDDDGNTKTNTQDAPEYTYLYAANSGDDTISGFAVDTDSGELSELDGSPFAGGTGVNALAATPDGLYLYGTNSGASTVTGFAINADTGGLSELEGSPFASCINTNSLAMAPDGDSLYVACFTDDQMRVYTIGADDGGLDQIQSLTSIFSSPRSVVADPSGQFVFVGIADNALHSFARIPASGALAIVPGTPPDYGEIDSMGISPSGEHLYIGERASDALWGAEVDTDLGTLTPIAGFPVTPDSNPSDPVVSPDGEHLYVAFTNDGVYAYSLGSDGSATPASPASFAAGTTPVATAITADGAFLYVANQGDATVTAFARDGDDGTLEVLAGAEVDVGTAVEDLEIVVTTGE